MDIMLIAATITPMIWLLNENTSDNDSEPKNKSNICKIIIFIWGVKEGYNGALETVSAQLIQNPNILVFLFDTHLKQKCYLLLLQRLQQIGTSVGKQVLFTK